VEVVERKIGENDKMTRCDDGMGIRPLNIGDKWRYLTSQAKLGDTLLGIRALQLDLDTLHNFKIVQ